MDQCPIQGESKTHIRLTLQKPEISTNSMGHQARKGFSFSLVYKAEVTSAYDNARQTYIEETARQNTETILNPYATKHEVQARNGVIQTLFESKKGKSIVFDQMGRRQANTSGRYKRKTKRVM